MPANSSLASHPPDNRFMTARRLPVLTGGMMSFSTTPCKDRDDPRVPAIAVNLNPAAGEPAGDQAIAMARFVPGG
jgi:hypothetical protein